MRTERQGKSGLGLAAQKRKVEDFLSRGHNLIGEFCDVQSGRDDARCELQKALALARRHDAKIIIARLDRFSRRVSFIANILEQGIGLVRGNSPRFRFPVTYSQLLVSMFSAVVWLARTTLNAKVVRFNLRSPSDVQYFAALKVRAGSANLDRSISGVSA